MDAKDRISKYIDFKGISIYKLEVDAGFSNGYWRKTRSISANAVENILRVYSDLDPVWVITGVGDMLKQPSTQEASGDIIPLSHPKTPDKIYPMSEFNLYDIDVSAGLSRLFSEDGDRNKAYLGKISIPNMPKCDGAVKVIGDSMYPLLKSGDIIAYKEVHSIESVQYGEIYILQIENDSDVSVVVKYVKKSSEGNDYLNLVSYNKEHDPKDVRKESITALARVILCIRQFSIM
ncbi:helix-turn-helix transcriptional regulator [Parabacteroides distasonis]|nr:helix-turn-helix transcriptional regulator [Parabacteroides distasonis]